MALSICSLLLVILGHEPRGAVKATLEAKANPPGEYRSNAKEDHAWCQYSKKGKERP